MQTLSENVNLCCESDVIIYPEPFPFIVVTDLGLYRE
jgi:hypothetical protein